MVKQGPQMVLEVPVQAPKPKEKNQGGQPPNGVCNRSERETVCSGLSVPSHVAHLCGHIGITTLQARPNLFTNSTRARTLSWIPFPTHATVPPRSNSVARSAGGIPHHQTSSVEGSCATPTACKSPLRAAHFAGGGNEQQFWPVLADRPSLRPVPGYQTLWDASG